MLQQSAKTLYLSGIKQKNKAHVSIFSELLCAFFSFSVPRAGIEPARLAALVFETNASTNSAIWAF